MGLIHPGALLQAGLSAVSQLVTPEALLVISLAVACLGVAVLMLTRPRTGEAAAQNTAEGAIEKPEEEVPPRPETQELKCASLAGPEAADGTLPHGAERRVTAVTSLRRETVVESGVAAARLGNGAGMAPVVPFPAPPMAAEGVPETEPAATSNRGRACGASALIAKVASLLPAGVAAPRGGEKSPARTSRGGAGFQPGSRFSRSQQAFLRIPIVLSGRDDSGAEFSEETCTLILLPQGAVIPMRRKMRPGERMTLSNPTRQKEAECDVFGVLPGPDGKTLVEVEFHEPQKNMWPVSFPAWAGTGAGSASSVPAGQTAAPSRTPALDSSGS